MFELLWTVLIYPRCGWQKIRRGRKSSRPGKRTAYRLLLVVSGSGTSHGVRRRCYRAIPTCLRIIATRDSPLDKLVPLLPERWLAPFYRRSPPDYQFQGAYGPRLPRAGGCRAASTASLQRRGAAASASFFEISNLKFPIPSALPPWEPLGFLRPCAISRLSLSAPTDLAPNPSQSH